MPQGFLSPPGAFFCSLIDIKYLMLKDDRHSGGRRDSGKAMSVYQIMYISSVTGTITADQCAAIARASAISNRADGVTGLLLFNGKRFLQVLEGPREAVDRVYQRIARDGRHAALVKLREQMVDAREFGEWAMAFDNPADPSDRLRDKVAALVEQAGPSTRAHFIGSAQMHRA